MLDKNCVTIYDRGVTLNCVTIYDRGVTLNVYQKKGERQLLSG
jgi:hypothetical protein